MRDLQDPAVLTSELVKRPSPSGGEHELLAWLQQFLEGQGLPVRRHGRNLVASHGTGGPRLWLNSHIDTVPPAEGYTFDPCCGHITVDGLVLGLGANDAKGSVAALTAAFLRFVRSHPTFDAGTLDLLVTCDEETGGEGLEWLRGLLEPPDAVLIGEPTGLHVANCCKGLVRAGVEVRGRAAHASRPWEGTSALRLALPLLNALHDDLGLPADPLLGPVTLVPTMIDGGTAPNALPSIVRIVLDGRTVPGFDNDALVARLHELVSRFDGCTLTVKSTRLRPTRTPDDGRLVQAALAVRGQAEPVAFAGVCDLVHAGDVDAIVCGPGLPERSHQADEFIRTDELEQAVGAYGRIIERYFLREG